MKDTVLITLLLGIAMTTTCGGDSIQRNIKSMDKKITALNEQVFKLTEVVTRLESRIVDLESKKSGQTKDEKKNNLDDLVEQKTNEFKRAVEYLKLYKKQLKGARFDSSMMSREKRKDYLKPYFDKVKEQSKKCEELFNKVKQLKETNKRIKATNA